MHLCSAPFLLVLPPTAWTGRTRAGNQGVRFSVAIYGRFTVARYKLLGRCRSQAPGHKFRFKNKLYSLDASTIDLCLSLFPWAKFRTTKGAVKVHMGLDHDGYLPTFVNITDGKTSDIHGARALTLPQGSILVADRGYVDFGWLNHLYSQGIFLVTRLKRGACYRVCESRPVRPEQGVICDQTIELTSSHSKYPRPLRRVGYYDAATGQFYDFLTNHFSLAPKTIADIYKDRWQVELFFKWIKQPALPCGTA